jgi:hypothetical protein
LFEIIHLQSILFLACAVISGWVNVRWRRLDDYDRGRVWKHYGWFSGLMSVGCCTGATSFGAWAMWLSNFYLSEWEEIDFRSGSPRLSQKMSSYAQASGGAAFQLNQITC